MKFTDFFKHQLGELYVNLETKQLIPIDNITNQKVIDLFKFYDVIILYMQNTKKNIDDITIDDFDKMFNLDFMDLYDRGIIRGVLYDFMRSQERIMDKTIFVFLQMNILIKIATNTLPDKYNDM